MPQLSHDLTRFKAHCEEKMRGLVASTVGAMEVPQAKRRQERKVVWLLLTLCDAHVLQSGPCCAQGRLVPCATQPERWFSKHGPGLPGHSGISRAILNRLCELGPSQVKGGASRSLLCVT